MKLTSLTAAERHALKARAHALDPVVMIGDAGLTDGVLREIERGLAAHELIKVRVSGDDRDERVAVFARIAEVTHAHPVQHIGKLLILYRPNPDSPPGAALSTKAPRPLGRAAKAKSARGAAVRASPAKRAASSKTPAGKAVRGASAVQERPERKPPSRPSRAAAGKLAARPPRTDRVRKSGQRSTKKAFQSK